MAGHIAKSEQKMNADYDKLTGIVRANALKDRRGRQALASMARAQRSDLQSALHQAVEAGKTRAAKLQAKMTSMNKATRRQVALQLSAQITSLKRQNQHAIDQFRMMDKKQLALLRKSLKAALNRVRSEARRNTIAAARRTSNTLMRREMAARRQMRADAKQRGALMARIRRNRQRALSKMKDAMAYQMKMEVLTRLAVNKKISKANKRVSAT